MALWRWYAFAALWWCLRPVRADAGAVRVNYCGHGHWDDASQECVCNNGWKHAGITDSFNFVGGVCSQFMCESDGQCEKLLGIEGATCPIHHWNCHCGWKQSIKNWLMGYETSEGTAKCMGVMYNFFFSVTLGVEFLLARLWMFFLGLMVVLLPFGRKRMLCDHHRLTMWNVVPHLCGFRSTCSGSCVLAHDYTSTNFFDDIAWSLYAFSLMVWLYMFSIALYLILVFIWTFALWSVVVLGVIFAGLALRVGEGGPTPGCSPGEVGRRACALRQGRAGACVAHERLGPGRSGPRL